MCSVDVVLQRGRLPVHAPARTGQIAARLTQLLPLVRGHHRAQGCKEPLAGLGNLNVDI